MTGEIELGGANLLITLIRPENSILKKLLPNVKLVTKWTGPHDYFEALHQGKSIEAFEKMSFTTTKNPSSWKFVQLKDNNHQQNKAQQPPAPIKPKSNFANHGDNSC